MSNRLLIAIGEAPATSDQMPEGISLLLHEADEIIVLSPRMPSRLEWLASDTDKSKQEADQRLERVLGQLEAMGTNVEGGTVGADDPVLAFEDAIARFSPNHILVGLRPDERAGWQEDQLAQKLWDRISIPLTIFDLPE